ncbi:hypothetical protein T492DRAFT_850449 [Pavlovales sp. CCMP2436]|nr:hypothetical protein T492DRAFT_850449 [Pavlovales sp. CCMP2436]
MCAISVARGDLRSHEVYLTVNTSLRAAVVSAASAAAAAEFAEFSPGTPNVRFLEPAAIKYDFWTVLGLQFDRVAGFLPNQKKILLASPVREDHYTGNQKTAK